MSYTFAINCTAMGIPTPEVIWRLNWGHVPDKCRQTSTPTLVGNNRALGVLECPDAQVYDQGAYSCEAINSKGSCFAGSPGCGQPGQVNSRVPSLGHNTIAIAFQDAILVVDDPNAPPPSGSGPLVPPRPPRPPGAQGGRPCPPGYFNSEAAGLEECIECFCFGHTDQCQSTELYVSQVRPSAQQYFYYFSSQELDSFIFIGQY